MEGTFTEINFELEALVSAEDFQLQLFDFQLSNYPNPFNPSTTILFDLPQDSKVKITIYNIKGQKVKTLVNEVLPAGEHSIVWNGRDSNGKQVGSGIYFYKLIAGDFQKVRKMLLLK
ncbi:MAG: T9SS type A sorting domain-containing protein [Candidatus Cloacimonetes bacterium]|nr:T9SS type A sorting domain-containing protein [Candidatus Cloacimonadota bacterium]